MNAPLWTPPNSVTAMSGFRDWLRERGRDFADYWELWRWSVDDLEGFWGALAEFYDVGFHDRPERVLSDRRMPGARWFPGATLNYAEHALHGPGKDDDALALISAHEDGSQRRFTYGQLRARVAQLRAGLVELGVGRGDRVAALAPNRAETAIALLAAASLGAVFASCSPEFGARAVRDRFAQIEPKVLVAVGGYVVGGRHRDIRSTVEEVRAGLPGLAGTVLLDGGGLDGIPWDELLARHSGAELAFDPVPFEHPLWVLYSSGTTGLPKGIAHSQGGIVLEHLKALGLHSDMGPGDRFCWFTTTGWMMWNYLVGGLLVGATAVLYEGSPSHPSLDVLWDLVERCGVTYFGTSAPYLLSCRKRELRPGAEHDLSALRAVGSTGAPLPPEGFRWVHEQVGDVQIASISGGTDVCTAFVGASPDLPVHEGEIPCPLLGAAVAAFDESGRAVREEVGELVVTEPMPCMPVFLWGDSDGSRMREAYFDTFPGVWRHGDWVRITERGSVVVHGRSDATLNRGGVRMGTAEFYGVVEDVEGVEDSLVVDTSAGLREGELLCFLVLAEGVSLESVRPELQQRLRAELSPRHVPNRFVLVDEVPRTLNGKKLEVPIKRVLAGVPPERAVSRDALANPDALAEFLRMIEQQGVFAGQTD
jgi:acetoacetyl-CoA synthetase